MHPLPTPRSQWLLSGILFLAALGGRAASAPDPTPAAPAATFPHLAFADFVKANSASSAPTATKPLWIEFLAVDLDVPTGAVSAKPPTSPTADMLAHGRFIRLETRLNAFAQSINSIDGNVRQPANATSHAFVFGRALYVNLQEKSGSYLLTFYYEENNVVNWLDAGGGEFMPILRTRSANSQFSLKAAVWQPMGGLQTEVTGTDGVQKVMELVCYLRVLETLP